MKTIIAIGRQYGSAGHQIGKALAEDLGISYYDKELLERAAKESGMSEELFENHDEKPTSSFLYSLVMDTYSFGYAAGSMSEMPLNQKVFLAQFDAIKKIGKEGPSVIVGRCADYALADNSNCMSVFIHADMDIRIRRIASKYNISNSEAKDRIVKTDKRRSSYYNYYTSKKWSRLESYNLCVDSGLYGIDGSIEIIKQAVKMKEQEEAARKPIHQNLTYD